MAKKTQKNVEWKTPRKIFLVFLFLILVLFGRYCYLALSPTINGRNMKVFAANRNTVSKVLTAKRGTIYDSTGKALAISAQVDTVSIDPTKIVVEDDNGDIDEAKTKTTGNLKSRAPSPQYDKQAQHHDRN